ncbi:MAG: UDP-N-acetylmuramoyl-L-alanine--D-glutamate ligase [Planctomycetes bacterium]|nr:UDP-N-acetylmuramoyl-L-alanine--D-glutamate ligase [Planctomycetota bacterium]MCP4839678.1 UDP-N-acetylmuramoyl-L-alanine--D-glutamate ligase [Planctomycetota bacterium]
MTELAGQRILLMGLGSFGGGSGCARWLLDQGADVTVTDLRSPEDLEQSTHGLDGARLVLGHHDPADFAAADFIVVNPAVPHPWDNPLIQGAQAAGVPLTTEIRLLTERLDRCRCIGITGTAGKSTTAAMTHHLLKAAGLDARLGGNIGGSLLTELNTINADTWLVLELSSAQLHWLGREPGWSPAIAGITNIAPNHLDWHETERHYSDSKAVIHRFQIETDSFVRGESFDPITESLRVPGEHNQRNARMAIELARCAAPNIDPLELASFCGLPHRLCALGGDEPPRFYDDSKSTTPEATLLAIDSFPDSRRVHLIAGGYDKGVSLRPIAERSDQLAGLYSIGATGPALAAAAPSCAPCETLERAVATAIPRMREGDVLLLSPGCASWDQFDDYRQRGLRFASLVAAETSAQQGSIAPTSSSID